MKNHMNRALALLVALLVLCAPIGAMAEESSITLAVSNLSLSIGEDFNLNVDITAQLDLAADPETGAVSGTLTALAAQDKALKAGFVFDPATMNLTAGLEGMTDAISVSLADMMSGTQSPVGSVLSEEDIAKITNLVESYMNLINVASEKGDALMSPAMEQVMTWLNGVMTDGHVGETTITVEDTELTAEQYDYELTVQEAFDIGATVIEAVKADPEMAAAVQAYAESMAALTGESAGMDITALDTDALKAELEGVNASIAGSLYVIDEASFLLDVNLVEEGNVVVPMEILVLTDEESSHISFSIDASNTTGQATTLTIEADIPTGGAPKFSFAVTGSTGSDATQDILLSLEGDFSEGANVTLYAQTTQSYSYNGETYTSLNAFGLNYTGAMDADENGITCPGTLNLYVNQDGMEINFSANVLFSASSVSAVEFNMPINVINIEEADEATQNALMQEAMEVLQQGLMILMGAPGMNDAMSLFQGEAA